MDQKQSVGRMVNKYYLNMELFMHVSVYALRIPHARDFPIEKHGTVVASICVLLKSYYSNPPPVEFRKKK